jgi:hypothetical protein
MKGITPLSISITANHTSHLLFLCRCLTTFPTLQESPGADRFVLLDCNGLREQKVRFLQGPTSGYVVIIWMPLLCKQCSHHKSTAVQTQRVVKCCVLICGFRVLVQFTYNGEVWCVNSADHTHDVANVQLCHIHIATILHTT